MPSISVALCTYNGERFIQEQLDSILGQSIPPDEIIVSDDGSTDDTLSILHQYRDRYPDVIKLNVNRVNLGYIKNFEHALRCCTGDLIFLSDQDDIWFPNKTRAILDYFDRHEACDAVFHDLELIDSESDPIVVDGKNYTIWDSLEFTTSIRDALSKEKLLEYILYYKNVATGAALAIRKRAKQTILPFQFNIVHDYEIALKLAVEQKIDFINCVLGNYRVHQNQQVGARTVLQFQPRANIRRFIQNENAPIGPKEASFFHSNLSLARSLVSLELPERILVDMERCFIRLKREYLKSLPFLSRRFKVLKLLRYKRLDAKLTDLFL